MNLTDLLKKQTRFWSISSLATAVALIPAKILLTPPWTFGISSAVTAFALYIFLWGLIHPKIYLGKGLALGGLSLSAAVTLLALGDVGYAFMWRRTFQLSGPLATFQEPEQKWAVSIPKKWSHESQNTGGTVNHVFRPSTAAPPMYFSVAARPQVGTQDMDLVVQNFLTNLPMGTETQVTENEIVVRDDGRKATRIVYTELTRRIHLKSEILFVLDSSHLYFLTISANPRWFDRHREILEKTLFSLEIFENGKTSTVGSASSVSILTPNAKSGFKSHSLRRLKFVEV